MRQFRIGLAVLPCLALLGVFARGQTSSIDLLDQDLQNIKQQRDDASSQVFTDFVNQTAAAMGSPSAAMNLYQQAGGVMPDPTPVSTHYDHETPSEKAAREQIDAERAARLGTVVQLQCGLLHFGGLLATKPDLKGLHDDWIAWLKAMPQTYVSLKDESDNPAPGETRRVRELRGITLRDSVITHFLNFHGFGDKEQGGWNVKELPNIYRSQVLEPLRAKPTPETLAAWDVYIGMKNIDQPDTDKWNSVEYPSLAFDRGCDDYAVNPVMDKLQFLVGILKANPTHPRIDEMIGRTHDLIQDYRKRQPASAPLAQAAAPAAPTDPNVTVTTTVQGDTTIVTTHTNAAPANPGAPAPPPPPPAPAPQ